MGSKLLTGWAIAPQYHSELHADTVIDSTLLVSRIIDERGLLIKNWEDILIQEIESEGIPSELTGFSMGAMLALRYAQLRPVKNLTLIAPTFSFVARDEFPFGIKERLLDSMILSLQSHPDKTVSKFISNCGIIQQIDVPYSSKILLKGLQFLKESQLPYTSFEYKTQCEVLHASDDRIISQKAGKQVSDKYNCSFAEFNGGHAALLKIT